MREDSYFYYWICDFGHFYEVRESSLPHGGISKIFFLDHFSPSFLGQKLYFSITDSTLRVKTMYELVKEDVWNMSVA